MDKFVTKPNYYPRTVLLELCYKCNFSCRHCGSSVNATGHFRKGEQITTDEIKKSLEELKVLGAQHLVLTGGESLVADNWEEVACYAVGLGYRVSMISNGYLIDESMAERIYRSGIRLVAMSLDGPKDVHNYLRRNEKAYDHVIRATRCLKEKKIQVNYVTTVMNLNIELLEQIEKIAQEEKINFWQIQIGVPMGQLAVNKELVIEPKDIKTVSDFIVASKKRGKVMITTADSVGYYGEDELDLRNNAHTEKNNVTRYFMGCSAGCYCIAIESNGDVKGCLSLQDESFVESNIRERSLIDIWNDENSFAYTRHFKEDNLKGSCKECKFGAICKGGCSSMAFNASGELYNNPYCIRSIG